MIQVHRLTQLGVSVEDINALLPQLRRDASEPLGTQEELEKIIADENVVFVAAKDGERIVGMGTSYLVQKFGKKTGFVEDVVVDEAYRGQGLGQSVMEVLIEESRKAGATQLYLTSGHDRLAAQKLYEKLGFKKKDTNVFKLTF